MTKYCPSCGQSLDEDCIFCNSCGNKIPVISQDSEIQTEAPNNIDQSQENELFFSEKEKIRKRGEKRYGKGSIRITDQNIYFEYKRKRKIEQHKVAIKDIEKALPIMEHFMHMPIATPGYANVPQDWHVLDIKLRDGSGFQVYIGTPTYGKDALNVPKFDKIMELLNPPGTIPEDPWQLDKVYRVSD